MSEVVALARRAAADNEHGTVMELLATRPLEMWFGMPLQELGVMLNAIPDAQLRANPNAFLVAKSFFSADPDAELADPGFQAALDRDPGLHRWHEFAEGWRARVRGDLATAYARLLGTPEVAEPVMLRIDPSNGMRSMFVTQAALTAALAGEFREALGLYEKALLIPLTPGVEFFARDANLRAALIHCLFGDPDAARIHRERARLVPRTTSWAETQLDLEAQVVDALLAPSDQTSTAFDVVMRSTYEQMNEIWPFFVAALERLAALSRRRLEARERIEALRATGLGAGARGGFEGSVFAQSLALDSLYSGNVPRAKEELAGAARDQWRTRLIESIVAILASAPRRAIVTLRDMAEQTRGLRLAERRRLMLLAFAYFVDGDEAEARAILVGIGPQIHPMEIGLLAAISSSFAALAADLVVPGEWGPEAPGNEPVRGAPRLTPSEIRVLGGLSRGRSRSQIAQDLFVSENTVKSHQRTLYRKLGVGTAEQAVRLATQLGMI